MKQKLTALKTLGDLKQAGYNTKTIKQELRDNLIEKLKNKTPLFENILGYEHTVIPEVERAILSQHNMLLLGLRGQAKTSIARAMIQLLDEYIPIVEGSELNDDPFHPITNYARTLVAEKGDSTPIAWLHRDDRYTEKLATPDVTVADLIGDVDPIKAANLKLNYNDERVLHFGLVPNANRGLFVINELPDLQARIQVALFNILQEGDIQIRGFKVRLPLDITFMFTANPEDYTNRGSIITPLKDRIQSQILTHYPVSIDIAKAITKQEVRLTREQEQNIEMPEIMHDLLENIAFEARKSEYIDQKSGVSARLSITAFQNIVSGAERRMLLNAEHKTMARIADLYASIPAITGKVELVYEGEQEGAQNIAHLLISKTIRTNFPIYFPDPESIKRKKQSNPYQEIIDWFNRNELEIGFDSSNLRYQSQLDKIPGLKELVKRYFLHVDSSNKYILMEFVIFALAEYSLLTRHFMTTGVNFKDILGAMFSSNFGEDDDDN